MTDLAGAMVQLYAYDAYGNAIGFDPAAALTEFLYSGEQFDAKIGQQYLRQRYYDPSTGRFNRLDPFFGNHTDPQSFHKYLYCHADPVNYTDPSGELAILPILGMVLAWGIIGAAVGGGMSYFDARLGGATHDEAMSAAKWGALIGGGIGAVLGPISYVAYAGAGIAQAFCYAIILQAELLGLSMGTMAAILSLQEGNIGQTIFRGGTTLIGGILGLRGLSAIKFRQPPKLPPPPGQAVVGGANAFNAERQTAMDLLQALGVSRKNWPSKYAKITNRDGLTADGISAKNRPPEYPFTALANKFGPQNPIFE